MSSCISILGSTGSIGRQTLDVADQLHLRVAALTANRDVDRLEAQCRKYRPRLAAMMDERAYQELKARLSDMNITVVLGLEGLVTAASLPEADTVVTAVSGMVGLKPTLAAIREKKTPVALGLAPEIDKVPVKILKNFEDMFGPGMMANAEALRFHGCQAMDAAQGKLPAVVISAEHYLRYGMMGADVLSNLTGAASARGLYAIVDCRTTRPELWLTSPMAGDGFTVMPYVGGDCVPESTDKGIFAVVRTANERSGEVQNLIAGDRPLYAAVAQQMARRGAALVVETGYSLDVKEVRKRAGNAFLLLPDCDGQNALPAFDDMGHGAMVVNYSLQYGGDVGAAVSEMKAWVNVL